MSLFVYLLFNCSLLIFVVCVFAGVGGGGVKAVTSSHTISK